MPGSVGISILWNITVATLRSKLRRFYRQKSTLLASLILAEAFATVSSSAPATASSGDRRENEQQAVSSGPPTLTHPEGFCGACAYLRGFRSRAEGRFARFPQRRLARSKSAAARRHLESR